MRLNRFTLGILFFIVLWGFWLFFGSLLSREANRRYVDQATDAFAISARVSPEKLRDEWRMASALSGGLASPDEVAGSIHRLHVVAVHFNDIRLGQRSVAANLDIRGLSRNAALIVYDRPVTWRLDHDAGYRPGRLAFEGDYPMQVRPLPSGILAGLKVPAFDSGTRTSPRHLKNHRIRFCLSLKWWGRTLGVPLFSMQVWEAWLPGGNGGLSLDDGGVRPVGTARIRNHGTASRLCDGA